MENDEIRGEKPRESLILDQKGAFFAKIVKDTDSSLVWMRCLVCLLFHWEWGCGEDVSQTWIRRSYDN